MEIFVITHGRYVEGAEATEAKARAKAEEILSNLNPINCKWVPDDQGEAELHLLLLTSPRWNHTSMRVTKTTLNMEE
jgi:hypothetical protein